MSEVVVGEIISVRVVDVASYGVKVESENREGFIQIPELSWDTYGLQSRISSICKVGDTLKVKILSLSKDKFYASLREANPELNPWNDQNKPCVGQKAQGKIVLVADYGYLVKLPSSIVALLPQDECEQSLLAGQLIDVKVVNINFEKQKVVVKIT